MKSIPDQPAITTKRIPFRLPETMVYVSRFFHFIFNHLPALIISGFLLVAVALFESQHKHPRLFVKVSDSAEGEMKVYWDAGSGFSETFSESRTLGKYSHQLIAWTIPEGVVAFRVDPTVDAEVMQIDSIRIGRFERLGSRPMGIGDLKHFHQIDPEPNTPLLLLRFHDEADDPYFMVFDVPEHISAARRSASLWLPLFVGLSLLPLLAQLGFNVRRSLK